MILSEDFKMRLLLVSNFDLSGLDLKIIENMDFTVFTKIYFPRFSYEEIETIIDNNLANDFGSLEENYKLSKLDKTYKYCLPVLGYNFHNLNDLLYNMRNNVEFASLNYIRKEKVFNILQSGKSFRFNKQKNKDNHKM